MKNIAIFASGEGSNFEVIAEACKQGVLPAKVVLMVCDKPNAKVVQRAADRGIDSFVFSLKDYLSKADYEREIVRLLDERNVDLVCLAGYMRIVSDVLLSSYEGKMINIHPSLLPAFKGAHAVEQAIEYGVKVFGITVHWVDASLDGGKIIAQQAFSYDGNDADEVHRIGQKIEHTMYVEVINKLLKEQL